MTSPVSVIITCFNQEDLIGRAIESVMAQSAATQIGQVIVVDDHSRDGSWQVIETLAMAHPKLTPIRHETNSGGASKPRNTGIKAATGTYVAFLDGDDSWAPGKIARDLETFAAHPAAGLVYGDYIEHRETRARRIHARRYNAEDPDRLAAFFVHGGPILPSAATVKCSVFDTVGGFDETYAFNEDPEMWLRIAERFGFQHTGAALVEKEDRDGSLGSLANGLANLDAKRRMTEEAIARTPGLAAHLPARLASIEFRTAVHHLTTGNPVTARLHLREAIRLRPGFLKPWGYLFLSFAPFRTEHALSLVRQTRSLVLNRIR